MDEKEKENEILEVMRDCGCKREEVMECVRCKKVDHEAAGSCKHGEWYCDACYDDLFVSWGDTKRG